MERKLIYFLWCVFAFGSSLAQSPVIGGYNVYYGTLHNHSVVQGGTGTDDEAYNYAKNTAGLDYFATSNHLGGIEESDWAAIRAASDKYNEDGVFTALWGFEWSGNGDITVINTEDYPGVTPEPYRSLVELSAWLDARNGLGFFNHPNRREGKVFGGFTSEPTDKIVGMELFNGNADFSMHYYNDGYWPDDGNLNHFEEANSRGWRIGASGSDDNHGVTWGTRNDYRMAILSEHLTRADLLAALEARRFYSTLDKNLALSFKMDTFEMGSTLEGKPHDIQILAEDADGESFTRVMLFRNGVEFKTWEIDTIGVNLTLPVSTFSDEFFYVKVTQADGDEAISSPIYMKGGLFNIQPTCSLTSPLNGTHFEAPQLVTLNAEALDADGPVASVEFFINGNSLGKDTLAPFSIDYTIPANGLFEITARVTDDLGSWVNSSPVIFTVGIFSQSESSRIADGMDDVEEGADGSMYTNSSDIELVYWNGNQIIGLRFTGVNIPPKAAIESASIQFTVDEVSTGACVLSIKGHNVGNSPPFTSVSKNVSNRVTTSAEVTWEPPFWPTVGAAGDDQKTPDLGSIIQEIVNHSGYTQSSAISIIITGRGERTAEAYEGDVGSAPELTVTYSFGKESATSTAQYMEPVIHIYPNPSANGKATLEISGEMGSESSLSIVDIWGRICYQSRIRNNTTMINTGEFKTGLYIVSLLHNNRVYSHKLWVD